jgi:predicted nucleic acid-binding protein
VKTEGYVVDASIAISWLISSQQTPLADRVMAEARSGTPFFVPGLWYLEVANTLLVLQRRKKIDAAQCARARAALGVLDAIVDDEDPRRILLATWQLADKHELTIYDATYLELAVRRETGLVTRDGDLIRAAKKHGVATL